MKGTKLLMIAAEIAAFICIGIALYKCASDGTIDYTQAGVIGMFSIVAVMAQSIQQSISWRNDEA